MRHAQNGPPDRRSLSWPRRLALLAYIGPLVAATTTIVLAALQPGYSHIGQFISELGAVGAPWRLIQNLFGHVFFGLSIALFALAAWRLPSRGRLTRVGLGFLVLSGALLALTGVFSCEPGCTGSRLSPNELIHSLAALFGFYAAILAMLFVGLPALRRQTRNRYVLASLGFAVLAVFFQNLTRRLGFDSPYRGLVQRLFLLNYTMWLFVMGGYVRRLGIRGRRSAGPPGGASPGPVEGAGPASPA